MAQLLYSHFTYAGVFVRLLGEIIGVGLPFHRRARQDFCNKKAHQYKAIVHYIQHVQSQVSDGLPSSLAGVCCETGLWDNLPGDRVIVKIPIRTLRNIYGGWVNVPHYFRAERGRRPYSLAVMLRVHIVQLCYNLSDPAMEDPRFREGRLCCTKRSRCGDLLG